MGKRPRLGADVYRPGMTPTAYKQALNRKVKALYGMKCSGCGRSANPHQPGRLQLAHKGYQEDSMRCSPGIGNWPRLREAYEHPERFYLLCPPCHSAYDWIREIKGVDVIAL